MFWRAFFLFAVFAKRFVTTTIPGNRSNDLLVIDLMPNLLMGFVPTVANAITGIFLKKVIDLQNNPNSQDKDIE
ncbi:MAG: hypothetical protein NPIRA06_20630 [Nitrospirales bacterium]|nr:MAG: hypothetical protein NPIRA06_20630 [Nitrospirales bacterium]